MTQEPAAPTALSDILALEAERCLALVAADVSTLDRITAEDYTHVNELYTGVLLHDLGAHVEGEEDKGASCTLGLLGILVLLHVLLVQAAVLD